uniref:Transmembrane protein 222 n=2 Tax=Felidae TaxID=9681 RepID=A0ABI7YVI0_FELCA
RAPRPGVRQARPGGIRFQFPGGRRSQRTSPAGSDATGRAAPEQGPAGAGRAQHGGSGREFAAPVAAAATPARDGGSGGADGGRDGQEAVQRLGQQRHGRGPEPLPLLRGVDAHPGAHVVFPHHRPHGHLHIHRSHSGLCRPLLRLGLSARLDARSPLTSALLPQQEDNMAFGKPAKYWKLDPAQVYASGPNAWDTAVHDASEEYKHRMHSLCCDNCHSHVALALNLMRYNNSTNWNMVTLCFFCLLYGKYVSVGAFVKTWLPFVLLLGIILTVSLVFNLR